MLYKLSAKWLSSRVFLLIALLPFIESLNSSSTPSSECQRGTVFMAESKNRIIDFLPFKDKYNVKFIDSPFKCKSDNHRTYQYKTRLIPLTSIYPPQIQSQIKHLTYKTRFLRKLPPETLKNLPKLLKITAENCKNLISIERRGFIKCSALEKLVIINATEFSLRNIQAGVFDRCAASLELLHFSQTKIGQIPRRVFTTRLINLNEITIIKSLVTRIDRNVFESPNIQQLFLHHNRIIHIHQQAFNKLGRLKRIDLSFNRLKAMHARLFLHSRNPWLTSLNFTSNRNLKLNASAIALNWPINVTVLNITNVKCVTIKVGNAFTNAIHMQSQLNNFNAFIGKLQKNESQPCNKKASISKLLLKLISATITSSPPLATRTPNLLSWIIIIIVICFGITLICICVVVSQHVCHMNTVVVDNAAPNNMSGSRTLSARNKHGKSLNTTYQMLPQDQHSHSRSQSHNHSHSHSHIQGSNCCKVAAANSITSNATGNNNFGDLSESSLPHSLSVNLPPDGAVITTNDLQQPPPPMRLLHPAVGGGLGNVSVSASASANRSNTNSVLLVASDEPATLITDASASRGPPLAYTFRMLNTQTHQIDARSSQISMLQPQPHSQSHHLPQLLPLSLPLALPASPVSVPAGAVFATANPPAAAAATPGGVPTSQFFMINANHNHSQNNQ